MPPVNPNSPEPLGLLPKAEVNYRPADATDSCASCRFFGSPDTCRRVEGVISPKDVCDLFEPTQDSKVDLEAMLMQGAPMGMPPEGVV